MTDRPQFTIRAMLGVTVALSVVFALISAGGAWRTTGMLLLLPVLLGSVTYLASKGRDIPAAIGNGVFLSALSILFFVALVMGIAVIATLFR